MSQPESSVFEVVKSNILGVMIDLDPGEITPDANLTDLGANSVDRVEIAINSMADLGVKVPREQLQGIANIRGLVEVLERYANH